MDCRLFFHSHQRIVLSRDFAALKESRRRVEAGHFFLKILDRKDDAPARFGVITSRRVGNAVKRNRLRRIAREAFRLTQHEIPLGYDVLLIPRASLLSLDFSVFHARFKQAIAHTCS